MQISRTIGHLRESERILADAFRMLAERHRRDPEVREITRLMAGWAEAHVHALAPFAERYGERPSEAPQRLRAALFGGTRVAAVGLVDDLADLALLVADATTQWSLLAQAAAELRDEALTSVCLGAASEVHREHAWIATVLKHAAPQALVVSPPPGTSTLASIPWPPSIANTPDAAWAPIAASAGMAGWLFVRPPAWAMPGAAASSALTAVSPAHPSARAYNIAASHAVALVVALGARRLHGRGGNARRLAAASLAVAGTVGACEFLRARHPPAAATAVLATLTQPGEMTVAAAARAVASVCVTAMTGEMLRKLRTGSLKPRRRSMPGGGTIAESPREGFFPPMHLPRQRTPRSAPAGASWHHAPSARG
jgi:hypothetical protein